MITKNKVSVALTESEHQLLKDMADKFKTSVSGALRMIIEDFISAEKMRDRVNKNVGGRTI
jgi:VIT1/CCC1 family predicted Fe2+/Mn2+ transporter